LYMAGSNISFLDLTKPEDGQVLCLTKWPATGHEASWSDPKDWFKWWTDSDDHEKVLNENRCTVPSLAGTECGNSLAPIMDMARPVASAMQGKFENLRFDVLGLSARIFLTFAIFIWVGMAVHDLALIGTKKKKLHFGRQWRQQALPSYPTGLEVPCWLQSSLQTFGGQQTLSARVGLRPCRCFGAGHHSLERGGVQLRDCAHNSHGLRVLPRAHVPGMGLHYLQSLFLLWHRTVMPHVCVCWVVSSKSAVLRGDLVCRQ